MTDLPGRTDHPRPGTAGRLSVPKASDALATYLREHILSGRVPEGSQLPTEAALSRAVGLSRGTVRGALRVLEAEGLVVVSSGPRRECFVSRPDAQTLERSLRVLLAGHGIPLVSLLETRDAIEPAAARLAAMTRSDADLATLDELSDQLREAAGDLHEFARCNAEWHVAVVTASGNEILRDILDGLCRAVTADPYLCTLDGRRAMKDALTAHDRVVAAIRQGDPELAATAMRRHVHSYRVLVERSG